MGKPGPWTPFIKIKEKLMIINVKQTKFRKSIDLLLTIFGWIYLFLFLYNFVTHLNLKLNLRFYILNLSNATAILIFTFFIVVISSASLGWWSAYNKSKYSCLNRRRFPHSVNDKEISEYFGITVEELRLFQSGKYLEIN